MARPTDLPVSPDRPVTQLSDHKITRLPDYPITNYPIPFPLLVHPHFSIVSGRASAIIDLLWRTSGIEGGQPTPPWFASPAEGAATMLNCAHEVCLCRFHSDQQSAAE
jgi:hypothetical protein